MSNEKRKSSPHNDAKSAGKPQKQLPEPIDVVDGVPDHSPSRSRRYLLIVFGLFALWIAFLVYCLLGGRI
ncbi:MAG: hypothetical protein KAR11_06140 [Phycisphaerae bacterium]|nr:hypothetical protein [Phycisphaerae bacterium]